MNEREKLITNWISEGASIDEVVERLRGMNIPTAKKTVSKVLKEQGFTYDKKTHQWQQGATNVELIETNVEGDSVTYKPVKIESAPLPTNAITLLDAIGVSPVQLNVLLEMANERIQGADPSRSIGEVAGKLKARTRGNKTFYMDKELAEDAAVFAERHGVRLSQLVEVALIEVMQKYKSN